MTEEAQLIGPDEKAFRADVSTGRFAAGVDNREWRVVEVDWPHAVIAISAAGRKDAPSEYFFRFELSGYPNTAATAQVWNDEEGRLATEAERPKVNYTPSPFRADWNEGKALYIPCDRLAHHSEWVGPYAEDLWDPARGISKYVLYVHHRLNENAYTGI